MDDGTPVNAFVDNYYDFKYSWLGWVALAVVAFGVLFAFLFAFAIMKLNFQTR
jgi:high-affinity Fe2+/Pb2+ permease